MADNEKNSNRSKASDKLKEITDMLEKGIKIEKADCLELVAVGYIAEILNKKGTKNNDF